MTFPRNLLIAFTASPTVGQVVVAAAVQARVSCLVTPDPAAITHAVAADLPLLISQDLTTQALDVLGTLPPQSLAGRRDYRTAVVLTTIYDGPASALYGVLGGRPANLYIPEPDINQARDHVEPVRLWITDQS